MPKNNRRNPKVTMEKADFLKALTNVIAEFRGRGIDVDQIIALSNAQGPLAKLVIDALLNSVILEHVMQDGLEHAEEHFNSLVNVGATKKLPRSNRKQLKQ